MATSPTSGPGGGGGTFNGGTITNPLVIDLSADLVDRCALDVRQPTTFGFSTDAFKFSGAGGLMFGLPPSGDVTTGPVTNGLTALGAGTIQSVGGVVRVTTAGGARVHTLDGGTNKLGLYGAVTAAQQTLHSGTVTPEQIALALEAATLVTGD